MSAKRQKQVLAVLLAALALMLGRQFLTSAPEAPAVVQARRAAALASVPPPPADVGLASLDEARPGPDDQGRNPFVFGARRPVESEAVTRRSARAEAATPPPPVFLPPAAPPLPPIPFKFIGLVEGASGSRRIAVLSDTKGLVVHGTEGAIIDGRFRILAIGAESLDIAYADGRGRQTLRLSGQ
jgi:hypothetical protein